MNSVTLPKALIVVLIGIGLLILTIVILGLSTAEGKPRYELVKDLFLPLVAPLIAVVLPLMLFFWIPSGQSRERFALELCSQYYVEEMRLARNAGWQHFVTQQRALPPIRRAERLNHFLDYLTNPEVHRGIDAQQDEVYQRATRVLDFFALINGCVARGNADPAIVKAFMMYYYLWWRDEIMEPLRKTRRITTTHPKFKPIWWEPLLHLDAMVDDYGPWEFSTVPKPEDFGKMHLPPRQDPP